MQERPKHLEKEIARQYDMLAEYDRLLGHTTDPIKREEYLHFQEIVRENIGRLEQGLEALPLPTPSDQPQNILVANSVSPIVQSASNGEQPAMQVFICYSKVDDKAASELYERLQAAGYKPWRDEEDLLPGQDWKRENRRALKQSRVALVLLSQKAVRTAGFNNALLGMAVDVADEQPDGEISLIPLRLDDCELPGKLEDRNLKPLDYFKTNSFERLLETLKTLQPASTIPSQPAAPEPTHPAPATNTNSGSGTQWNIGSQQAGQNIYQGNIFNIHNHGEQPQPTSATAPTSRPASSQGSAATPDFASFAPELNDANERFALAEELLKCEALGNKPKRAMVISLLPDEIRHNINEVDTPRLHVLEIVNTCDKYENGLIQLLEAVYKIEGNTKAWRNLVTYLSSR